MDIWIPFLISTLIRSSTKFTLEFGLLIDWRLPVLNPFENVYPALINVFWQLYVKQTSREVPGYTIPFEGTIVKWSLIWEMANYVVAFPSFFNEKVSFKNI